MRTYPKIQILIPSFLVIGLVLVGCGGAPEATTPTATETDALGIELEAAAPVSDAPTVGGAEVITGLPVDVETYYETMVFIHGTAQLMSKFDLAAITSSDDQSLILMLIAIPGVMDDHLIAANKLPVPAGLESAWEQAGTAEANLIRALQDVLTTYDLESFARAVASNEALAYEAVAEAEAVLAADYGASADDIAAANRAALTDMGEAYKTIASMLVVVQSEAGEGGE